MLLGNLWFMKGNQMVSIYEFERCSFWPACVAEWCEMSVEEMATAVTGIAKELMLEMWSEERLRCCSLRTKSLVGEQSLSRDELRKWLLEMKLGTLWKGQQRIATALPKSSWEQWQGLGGLTPILKKFHCAWNATKQHCVLQRWDMGGRGTTHGNRKSHPSPQQMLPWSACSHSV